MIANARRRRLAPVALTGALTGALVLIAACRTAGEHAGAGEAPSSGSFHEDGGAASDDEAAMMARWMELATPGEHHKHLAALEGRWAARARMWMDPDAPPVESVGRMTNQMVLGGRVLLSRYEGTMMGGPFQGLGLMGYDNAREEYVGIWTDTTGTMIMPASHGTCSEDGKVIETERAWVEPVSGVAYLSRDVTTVVGPDEHTFEMYSTGPDGVEHQNIEIVYTRLQD